MYEYIRDVSLTMGGFLTREMVIYTRGLSAFQLVSKETLLEMALLPHRPTHSSETYLASFGALLRRRMDLRD